MVSSPISPIEDLNAAIQSHNPFNKPAIVKDQDVWGKGFPDVATLNAHASDEVFQAIERVRTSQSSQDKVTSLAITAVKGVGKSHVIGRIRHRLEHEGGALFVYASVDNYVDLDLIKYQFQQTLAESLKHTGSQRVMQWQEVATAMANEAFKVSNPNANLSSPAELVKKFDKAYANTLAKNRDLMNELTKQVLKAKPNAEPDIVRAILWTLSETEAPFAIKWLSGQDLAQFKAEQLGLPNPNKTYQDREAEALNTIRQILNLVSNYNPVLICFDEIDVLNDCGDAGFTTPQVIADLVKRLFDTIHQSELSQGVVILTVMMPDTWTLGIKSLQGGITDRVSAKGKPIDLKHMEGDSIIEVVTLWLSEFYRERNLTSHERIYPFQETQLRELGKEKLPVRDVLRWCAENFKVDVLPLLDDPFERFELAFQQASEAKIGDYLDNNSLIAEVLFFSFQMLKSKTVEGVIIEDVTDKFEKKSSRDKNIDFKIIGRQNGKVVNIGVIVAQQFNARSLKVPLRRLTEYSKSESNRGCLVRSKQKKINRKSEAYTLLIQLTSELGGEFVDLIEEQIKPLIALHSVYQKRKTYKLSDEQIFDFILQKQLAIENLLLQEILSAPSGQIDDVALEEIFSELTGQTPNDTVLDDTTTYDEFTSLSSTDNTDEEADLIELFE